jgi:hypothetical protein
MLEAVRFCCLVELNEPPFVKGFLSFGDLLQQSTTLRRVKAHPYFLQLAGLSF